MILKQLERGIFFANDHCSCEMFLDLLFDLITTETGCSEMGLYSTLFGCWSNTRQSKKNNVCWNKLSNSVSISSLGGPPMLHIQVCTYTRKPLLLLSKWANREYSRLIWLSVTKGMKENMYILTNINGQHKLITHQGAFLGENKLFQIFGWPTGLFNRLILILYANLTPPS